MEGGVLKKEDEKKYKRLLPSLTDTPAVARKKAKDLIRTLALELSNYMENYERNNQDVSGFKDQMAYYKKLYQDIEAERKGTTDNSLEAEMAKRGLLPDHNSRM
jgi:hypothetical protein